MPKHEEEESEKTNRFKVVITDGSASRTFEFDAPSTSYPSRLNSILMQLPFIMQKLTPEFGLVFPYRKVTLNTIVNAGDFLIVCDCSGGNISVELPYAGTGGRILLVEKQDAEANTVTVNASGSDTIEGDPSVVLSSQYDKVLLVSDGSSTWIKLV
jgi:hypothetical protein